MNLSLIFSKTCTLRKRIIILILLTPLLLLISGCAQKFSMEEQANVYQSNKTIPKEIFEETKKALSYFPELEDVTIEFRFKDNIRKSFMQAQPQFSNLFKGKNNRSYYVFVSSKVHIEEKDFSVEDIPSDVLTGWLGHELGHIMDYRDRSAMGLMIFGLRYVTSRNHLKRAERIADTYAVNHGMGDYILQTKDFILNHTHLSEAYKDRIKRLYLSPEEIVVLVNKIEEDIEKAEKDES